MKLTTNRAKALENLSSSLWCLFLIAMEMTGSGINILSIEQMSFGGVLASTNVSPLAQLAPGSLNVAGIVVHVKLV